jgi:hypothetical protein
MLKLIRCNNAKCENYNKTYEVHLPMAGPGGMFFDSPLVCRCGQKPTVLRYKRV